MPWTDTSADMSSSAREDIASTTYLRLRILHLSSHFIDGHFRLETTTWIDGQLPRPYSRDYAELHGRV